MLCAISPNAGLIHKMMITGGAKQENFDQFINELFHLEFGQAVNPIEGVNKFYLIFDNAPCHRGIEARLAENIPENFELIRLPPYSCELNPIEFSFNSLSIFEACYQYTWTNYSKPWSITCYSKKTISFATGS